MLNALKNQLVLLAEHSDNTLQKQIKKRLGAKAAAELTPKLRNFILVMPEMIAQIRAWADHKEIPLQSRKLHGFLMTYLYHPVDFLPEEAHGFFGYLDDAYVVGSIYYKTLQELGNDHSRFISQHKDIADQVAGWLVDTQKVIHSVTLEIDRMIDELAAGDDHRFQQLMERQNQVKTAGS